MHSPAKGMGAALEEPGSSLGAARPSAPQPGGPDAAAQPATFQQLASSLNLHDLADVPLPQGRIAPCQLLRCAKLDGLAPESWRLLVDECRPGLVVDLRTNQEIPSRFGLFSRSAQSTCAPCACVNLPLEGLGLLMTPWQRSFGPAWVRMRRKLWANPQPMFEKMYAAMVLDAENRQVMGRFFQLALAPRDGALMWHCAQGTDRTGVMAALFLEVLGATRESILEHHAACYAHSAPADPRPQLRTAYKAIEDAYGSVQAYLEQGLGIAPALQQNLRQRYLA